MPDFFNVLIALVVGAAIGVAANIFVSRLFDRLAGRPFLPRHVDAALIGAATLLFLFSLSRYAF